jgi:hypothetical protein
MDMATLYKNLENNILRRDRINKRLRRNCRRARTEEDLGKVVEQVKALRTSRKALRKILGYIREIDDYRGFEESLVTILEYMLMVGVHIEREVLQNTSRVLRKHKSTEQYAEEIDNIDMSEIEMLGKELEDTYSAIVSRSGR